MKSVALLAITLGAMSYVLGLVTPSARAVVCWGNWSQTGQPGCSGCSTGQCGDCIQGPPFGNNSCGSPATVWICFIQQQADQVASGDNAVNYEVPCSIEVYCTAADVFPCAGNKCKKGAQTGNESTTTFYQLQPRDIGSCVDI